MYDAGMGSRNAGEESEGNLVRVVHFVDRRALVKFLLLSNCCAISSAYGLHNEWNRLVPRKVGFILPHRINERGQHCVCQHRHFNLGKRYPIRSAMDSLIDEPHNLHK